MPSTTARALRGRGLYIALLIPAALAVVSPLVARLLPGEVMWAAAASSILYSLPPWLMAAWPLWGLSIGRRTGRWGAASLSALGLAFMGRPVATLPGAADLPLSVVSANVNAFSPDADPAPMEAALGAWGATVVGVVEKRALSIPGMVRAADNFDDPLPTDSHGTAIFCTVGARCEAIVTEEIGSKTWKMPVGLARLDDAVCVLFVHGPPPLPIDASGLPAYVDAIARRLKGGRMSEAWGPCRAGDPALLMGDLNGVPGSDAHRRLVDAGLTDHLQGTGVWGATWPAGGGWPLLPVFRLDQLLVGDLEVGDIDLGFTPGSDHRAVFARVGRRTDGSQ